MKRFLLVSFCALAATVLIGSCNGSGGTLEGLGEEFDIGALSDPVLRFCAEAQCSDYSQDECEFYLRFDSMMFVRLSQNPDACFEALVSNANCFADSGSCRDETCPFPETECAQATIAPDIDVPESVEPTRAACEFRADCDQPQNSDERALVVADCQAEYVSRSEIFQHDRGPACAQGFIDFIACLGNAPISCDAGGEEEDAACPAELENFIVQCFPDDEPPTGPSSGGGGPT